MKHYSYAKMVKPHSKSIVLGGARVLFPVDTDSTAPFAQIIAKAISVAEQRAYKLGREDAQLEMRKALGVRE